MRQLRVLFGAVLVSAAFAVGYLATRDAGQPATSTHVMDRRCRGGCTGPSLPSGAVYVFEASQVGGASGDLIGGWASSGTVRDVATQSNAQFKPVLRTAGLNGKNTLAFDGQYDNLTVPNQTNLDFVHKTGAFDMFAVYRRAVIGQQTVFANTNYNDATWPGFWFSLSAGAGGVYCVVTKSGGATVITFNTVASLPVGAWRIIECGGDGSSVYATVDLRSGSVETQIFSNPKDTVNSAHFTANIGAHANGLALLSGDMAALYVFNHKLSTAEKATLLAYVLYVWGV